MAHWATVLPTEPEPTPVRVALIDDHAVFVQSLAAALATQPDLEVCGTATTARDGLALVDRCDPHVVLVDYRLPDSSGTELVAALRRRLPEAAVVVLTAVADERLVMDAIEAGCTGLLTKDQHLPEVLAAIRAAARGEAVLPPGLLNRMLPRLRRGERGRAEALTDREREVLALMAEGLSNQAMADRLHLSLNTVRNHTRNVLGKLDAHSKLEAVSIATRRGLIAPIQDR